MFTKDDLSELRYQTWVLVNIWTVKITSTSTKSIKTAWKKEWKTSTLIKLVDLMIYPPVLQWIKDRKQVVLVEGQSPHPMMCYPASPSPQAVSSARNYTFYMSTIYPTASDTVLRVYLPMIAWLFVPSFTKATLHFSKRTSTTPGIGKQVMKWNSTQSNVKQY